MSTLTNKERMDQLKPFTAEIKKACNIDMANVYPYGDDNKNVMLSFGTYDNKKTTHVNGTDGEIKMFINGMIAGCNLAKKPPF